MKILGIDPGLRKTGWGVVVWKNNSFSYINDGFFFQNDELELGQKLLRIFDRLSLLIKETKPAPGIERVVYAGLPEYEEKIERENHGIPYHPEVLDWFKNICAELGIDWKLS